MSDARSTAGDTRPASAGDEQPTGADVLPDLEGAKRLSRMMSLAADAAIFKGRTVRVLAPADTGRPASLSQRRLQELLRAALALSDETPS